MHNTAALAAISEAALHMNSRITDLVGHYCMVCTGALKAIIYAAGLHTCHYVSGKPGVGDENSTAICRKGQSGCTWQGKTKSSVSRSML